MLLSALGAKGAVPPRHLPIRLAQAGPMEEVLQAEAEASRPRAVLAVEATAGMTRGTLGDLVDLVIETPLPRLKG